MSLLFCQLNAAAVSLSALLPVKRRWNSRSAGKPTTKLLFIVSPSLTHRKPTPPTPRCIKAPSSHLSRDHRHKATVLSSSSTTNSKTNMVGRLSTVTLISLSYIMDKSVPVNAKRLA
ncbi:hypothetical protein CFOL_v3_26370 [Cephalotus follicularis]|uniref:Uncharacterized protein n=1 Tax=Cephalotus follicularis TaxID=3775 RepID=A0A1Q3CRQ1_CEPFO|nr:hypothetical protein CFOL_v3_26370 [Cephalotus follicularis]